MSWLGLDIGTGGSRASRGRTAIGWREGWVVVKSSAERRLGKPLLMAYLFLALFGIVVVVVCIVIMHL